MAEENANLQQKSIQQTTELGIPNRSSKTNYYRSRVANKAIKTARSF